MATKFANIKGIKFDEGHLGSERGGVAVITFDCLVVYTGGTDTIQFGGGGNDEGVVTALSLAAIMQNRRRDGKTVTLYGATSGPIPGLQVGGTNTTEVDTQTVAVSGANVTANLFNAPTAGAACTTLASAWDRPCSIVVQYRAV